MVKAAISGGNEIMKIYVKDKAALFIEKKADDSPVTIADKKASLVIEEELKNLNLPVLSEEGSLIDYETRKKWEYFFLVDPLDGTKEFIKKNGEFTVNIALINKNLPICGVVYLPVLKILYYSYNNSSFKFYADNEDNIKNLNIENIIKKSVKINSDEKPEIYTIIASRSHQNKELEKFIDKQKKLHGKINFIEAGSSLKFCKISEGKAHVYPRPGPTMEWDTAAAHSICNGAGLKVREWGKNRELTYNKKDLGNPFFIVE